jgi:nitrite reductase/ring-hydroxylating ferredoxin subunit
MRMKIALRRPHQLCGADGPGADPQGELVCLGVAADLAERRHAVVVAAGRELLVLFGRRRFTVLENRCPHLGTPLSQASIGRRTLTCAQHSYRYALDTGAHVPTTGCQSRQAGRLTLFPSHVAHGFLYAVLPAQG